MLVPHVGSTLELLCANGVLSRETSLPSCLEITRALLKCQMELSKCYNWRIKSNFLQQMERLPNCMPSDFIHQHFSPVILNCVLESRAKPVRSQASRTLLIFLRYNLKEIQRKWIRDNLITHLCYSKSCYTRHVFILACVHAAELFSNSYFKKHFFEPLLSLADDPISNIRLCVVGLLPSLYKMLIMPEDRKLQTNIDNIFSKLDMMEKDKDVKDILRTKLKEIRNLGPTNKHDYLVEQRRKEEEENKIFQGKITTTTTAPSAQSAKNQSSTHVSRDVVSTNSARSHPIIARSTSAPPRVSKTPSTTSGQVPSDMSFLEQHFYIDAGISLPRENVEKNTEQTRNRDVYKIAEDFDQLNLAARTDASNDSSVPTVSVENVNIETMSESELKKLETSTTNITDDVKVNLRKWSKKSASKSLPNDTSCISFRCKRYSSVFPSTNTDVTISNNSKKKSFNRRSLNIGAGDFSKIPVSIKKSQSNADVKTAAKQYDLKSKTNSIIKKSKYGNNSRDNDETGIASKVKGRPKSEILLNVNNNDKWTPLMGKDKMCSKSATNVSPNTINTSITKDTVPITNSINHNTSKISVLPVLKR
jgi:hypothetical protein